MIGTQRYDIAVEKNAIRRARATPQTKDEEGRRHMMRFAGYRCTPLRGGGFCVPPPRRSHGTPRRTALPGRAARTLKTALAGRYAIDEEIGAGGMATVYLADDLKHHRKVAVKVLRPELASGWRTRRWA